MWQIEGCWHSNIPDSGHSVTGQSAISEIGSALHHDATLNYRDSQFKLQCPTEVYHARNELLYTS